MGLKNSKVGWFAFLGGVAGWGYSAIVLISFLAMLIVGLGKIGVHRLLQIEFRA